MIAEPGRDGEVRNLADAFEVIAERLGDAVAIAAPRGALTWRELDTAAGRFAAFLTGRGVGAGDRVAIGVRNRPEYLVALLGSVKAGAVPVNVNHRYRSAELAHVIGDSGARWAVHEPDAEEAFAAPEVSESGLAGRSAVCSPQWEEVVGSGEVLPHEARPDAEWLLYTGGTTGRPKAVRTSHRNVLGSIASVARRAYATDVPDLGSLTREGLGDWVGSREDRVVMLAVPPFMHATGLYNALGALLCGGVVVMLEPGPYDPADVARTLAERGVTDLTIVGDVMGIALAEELDAAAADGRPYDLGSLRRVVSSGVRWDVATKEGLLRHADCTLYDIVAATEGGPYALHVSSRAAPPASAALRLAPRARLIDENGDDVPPGSGRPGLLAAPAPAGVEYAGQGAGDAFRELGGSWYSVPGDLALLEEDGTLRLLGRGSAVVNTGGEKVFAEEVETALREHPGIVDAVVVGVPDRVWGEVVTAVAVSSTDPPPDDVRGFVGERLAGYKAPRAVHWVPQLRRTGAGKIDLRWAREVARDGTAPSATG